MSDVSAIEWTDSTWNVTTGCTRVSPGCANCYIERTPPFRISGRRFERVGNEETTGLVLHPERLKKVPRGPRIFVNSLSDLFHEEIPDDFIAQTFDTMRLHPDRTFQVLTKRPERALDLVPKIYDYAGEWEINDPDRDGIPLPNVWLGVSIENARYTWRADVLREIPAAVRFISAEPLLGSLFDAGRTVQSERAHAAGVAEGGDRPRSPNNATGPLDLTGIDWLIVGGESGPGARPMHPDWARELRDQCLYGTDLDASRPAFFFKQWGGKTAKAGGRELDGRTWDEMPTATADRASA